MYDDKAKAIFDVLIQKGVIPETGQFEITDHILHQSYIAGRKLHSHSNKKRSPSDVRFHKKIAGINLLHLNNERAEKEEYRKEIIAKNKIKHKSGILYIISNTSFHNYIKVGITKDLKKRLTTYQTYDPERKYKVEKYVFLQDVRSSEKYLLEIYKIENAYTGEWISKDNFDNVCEYMNNF